MRTPTAASPVAAAEVLEEYGPFEGAPPIHGVSFADGRVWAATGEQLIAVDPADGAIARRLDRAATAGTAFDGQYLYQIAGGRIDRLDPNSGQVLASIPAPGGERASGLTWAEGSLWVGQYRDRSIVQIDPQTGAVLRTLTSDRFVTGVSFVDGELWHGTWEGDDSELRRLDPETGVVLDRLVMPAGTMVSGLESDGAERLYCGGGSSGKVRAVRRPRRRVA
jgi:outer membrane protein assembly factor BamB